MRNKIITHLRLLEKEKDLKILMAVESGSRAWGFPSPDSDYDVRIVYVRKVDWYLSIQDKKESMDYFLGKELDINGWDIRKMLRLLRKSNATPFEWAQSPVVYFEEVGFRKNLLDLAAQYFQPYHTLNHYKGIAKNSYRKDDLTGSIKLKKLFYVIRPLFAINWIRKKKTVPPMDIFSLIEVMDDEAVKSKVFELIKIKATADEDYVYRIDALLENYIAQQFQKLDILHVEKENVIPGVAPLNDFFRKLLNQHGS